VAAYVTDEETGLIPSVNSLQNNSHPGVLARFDLRVIRSPKMNSIRQIQQLNKRELENGV